MSVKLVIQFGGSGQAKALHPPRQSKALKHIESSDETVSIEVSFSLINQSCLTIPQTEAQIQGVHRNKCQYSFPEPLLLARHSLVDVCLQVLQVHQQHGRGVALARPMHEVVILHIDEVLLQFA